MLEDQLLIQQLNEGNKSAFTLLFKKYYQDLVFFSLKYITEKETSEDIVQSIFLKLWRDRKDIVINTSLKSFLLKSVRNACLDHIRHVNVKNEYVLKKELLETELALIDSEKYILYSELNNKLMQALEQIPPAYKQTFELNKFEGKKYKEISEILNVSERTVEVRIHKTILLLRTYLKEFLIATLVLISSFFY